MLLLKEGMSLETQNRVEIKYCRLCCIRNISKFSKKSSISKFLPLSKNCLYFYRKMVPSDIVFLLPSPILLLFTIFFFLLPLRIDRPMEMLAKTPFLNKCPLAESGHKMYETLRATMEDFVKQTYTDWSRSFQGETPPINLMENPLLKLTEEQGLGLGLGLCLVGWFVCLFEE